MSSNTNECTTENLITKLLSATPDQKKQVWDILTNNKPIPVTPARRNTNLYSITGTARLLGLSRSSIYALIHQKRLDILEISGAPKVVGQSIEEFISGLRPANEITAAMVDQSKKRYSASGKSHSRN